MDRIERLLAGYRGIERSLQIRDRTADYRSLVTAADQSEFPVQRWFRFKEAFSPTLLAHLVADWSIDPATVRRVLDPFCGAGSTLLGSQYFGKRSGVVPEVAVGIEVNPLLRFVAQTKASWHEVDASSFKLEAERLMAKLRTECHAKAAPLPALTTLSRSDVFDQETQSALLQARAVIEQVRAPSLRLLLLLGYANSIEAASGFRKDGRALRIEVDKQRAPFLDALNESWLDMQHDLEEASAVFSRVESTVLLGDGRSLDHNLAEYGPFDVVLFSPPYLNNIDYTEVYKVEAWLCGFLDSYEGMRDLRRSTLRSHPSVRFSQPVTLVEDPALSDVVSSLDQFVACLPEEQGSARVRSVVHGYFDDMHQALTAQWNLIRPGGRSFCVVGNSLHGPGNRGDRKVPIASDVLIARMAAAVGFDVESVDVARTLARRTAGETLARESIIVMRRPG